MTYKVDSPEAEEFIHHEEILETLEYARTNKDYWNVTSPI